MLHLLFCQSTMGFAESTSVFDVSSVLTLLLHRCWHFYSGRGTFTISSQGSHCIVLQASSACVQVRAPVEFQGTIFGDLNRRKGAIQNSESEADEVVMQAQVRFADTKLTRHGPTLVHGLGVDARGVACMC